MKQDEQNLSSLFDERLKAWARRAPKTRPDAAARRLIESLGPMRPPVSFVRLAAAAALVAVISASLWFGLWHTSPGPALDAVRGLNGLDSVGPPPVGDNVVLWWLDADTPVYFILHDESEKEN